MPTPNTKTVTIKMTFNADQCVDVDAAGYDPIVDVESIMGFGIDHYNLEDWEEVTE